MAEPEPDPLAELRDRVRATQAAAERIVREATAEAEKAAHPPSVPARGWAPPGAAAVAGATTEAQALVALLESLRDLLPEDLRAQVTELVRQLVLVLRALLDWLAGRLEPRRPGEEPTVEDIPIL